MHAELPLNAPVQTFIFLFEFQESSKEITFSYAILKSFEKHMYKISINIPAAVQADRQEPGPYHLVKHHLPVVTELQYIWKENNAWISDPSSLDS